jgi:hypothetical protein
MPVEIKSIIQYRAVGTKHNVAYLRNASTISNPFSTDILLLRSMLYLVRQGFLKCDFICPALVIYREPSFYKLARANLQLARENSQLALAASQLALAASQLALTASQLALTASQLALTGSQLALATG